jgi:hypothetical protein
LLPLANKALSEEDGKIDECGDRFSVGVVTAFDRFGDFEEVVIVTRDFGEESGLGVDFFGDDGLPDAFFGGEFGVDLAPEDLGGEDVVGVGDEGGAREMLEVGDCDGGAVFGEGGEEVGGDFNGCVIDYEEFDVFEGDMVGGVALPYSKAIFIEG